LHWLKEIFLPETAPAELGHRMLIIDGYSSYTTTEFLWVCKQNKVQVIFLPAHVSHVLQPLDLSIFSLLKQAYRKNVQNLIQLDDTAPIKKFRFIQIYDRARRSVLSSRTIREGWKAAGLVL
jgi:hypothetical protein